MAKVELKQPIVEEISNSIKDAQSVVLVNYSVLTVEQDTILRKELREAGVQYKVYKNTMMRRAFEGTAFESLSDHLHGTNAIAISETDATAPARILAKYANTDEIGDAQVAEIKAAQEKMMESAQKLFAKMYEQTQQAGGQAGPDMNMGGGAAGSTDAGNNDDVVDADYKEV